MQGLRAVLLIYSCKFIKISLYLFNKALQAGKITGGIIMNYRILMNFSILLFVILTLQCSNLVSSNKGDIIGTWVGGSHTLVYTFIKDSLNHYDTLYDTGIGYKTYSITYDTIKISEADSFKIVLPIFPGPLVLPFKGTWSLINDSLIVYPVSGGNRFSTRYLITKLLPDSLIFSSSDGTDTCENQSN
jgi:hypothetical protein